MKILLKLFAIIPCIVVAIVEFLCKTIAWIPVGLMCLYILTFYPIANNYEYNWVGKIINFAKYNFKWTKNLWYKYE